MLSVAIINAAQASTYYKKDDYYTNGMRKDGVIENSLSYNGETGFSQNNVETKTYDDKVSSNEKFRTLRFQLNVSPSISKLVSSDKEVLKSFNKTMKECFIKEFNRNGIKLDKKSFVFNKHGLVVGIDSYKIQKEKIYDKQKTIDTTKALNAIIKKIDNTPSLTILQRQFNSANLSLKTRQVPGRIGADLTFSAPKSCSLLRYNDNYKSLIESSHYDAIKSTFDLINAEYGYARKNQNGEQGLIKCDLDVIMFEHELSRNKDPQFHTHSIVFSDVKCSDGKTRSFEHGNILKNQKQLGYVYRTALAKNLIKKGFEIEITDDKKFFFEVKGVPREFIKEMSSRRQQIEKKYKEMGLNPSQKKERHDVVMDSRKAKGKVDLDKEQLRWLSQVNEINLVLNTNQTLKSSNPVDIIKEIESQTFAFRKDEFVYMFKELDPLKRVEDIQTLFNDHLKKGDFLSITRDGVTYYSTQDTLNKERKIRQLVKTGDQKSWYLDIGNVPGLRQGVDISTLKNDQRQSLFHTLSTSNQFCGVIGDAGSGKTYMLKQLKEICDKNNISVRGMAFTGNAVEVMSKDSGIEASTIHRFLNEMEKVSCQNLGISKPPLVDGEVRDSWNLDGLKEGKSKELWVFDEASMVNNNLAYNVFFAANKVGAKVVLIGDPKQLDSIGTGDPFSNLVKDGYLNASRMSEVFRQKEIWNVYDSKRLNQVEKDVIRDMAKSNNSVSVFHEEKIKESEKTSFDRQEEIQTNQNRIFIYIDSSLKKGVEKLAAGDIDSSLDYLDKKVEVIENSSERHLTIADDFTENYNEKDFDSIITTSTNTERKELTSLIRDRLKDKGILSDEKAYTVINIKGDQEELCFAKNDRIMCLSNSPSLGLNNGTKGTIKDINHETGDAILEIEGSSKQISINLKAYQNITHAYAVTTYKSQGMSIKDVFVNFDASNKNFSYRNNAYVSVSRAKENLKIYTNDKDQLKKAFNAEKTKISLEDFTDKYSFNKIGQKFRIKKGFETDFLYKNQIKTLANKVTTSLTNSIKKGFEKAEDLLSRANNYFKDFLSEAQYDVSKINGPGRNIQKTVYDAVSSSLGRDVTSKNEYDTGADLSRLDPLSDKHNVLKDDQAIDLHLPVVASKPDVSIKNVTGMGI